MTPLCPELNAASVRIAGQIFPLGFDVRADAPNTYEELVFSMEHLGRMAIWTGDFGTHSCFADPEVWREFRAWHDWVHYRYDLRFNLPDEHGVCHVQAAQLMRLYGRGEAVERMIALTFCTILDTLEEPLAGRTIADGWAWARDKYERWLPYARRIIAEQGPTDLDAIAMGRRAYAIRAEIGPVVPAQEEVGV